MKFLLRFILSAVVVLLVSYIVPEFYVSGFLAAFIFAMLLGFVNALVRPLLVLLTLPLNILTLGLFTLVINALLFWFASSISFGVEVQSFAAAFWGSIVVWIFSTGVNMLLKDNNEDE